MSIPRNPINLGSASTHSHMLIAFEYAEDAIKLANIDPGTAIVGEPLTGKNVTGKNVVVVNEMVDRRFTISEAMWDFNYAPEVGVSTSSSTGKIVVADRRSAYSFIDFMRDTVLETFSGGTGLSHITFVLKTTFYVSDSESDIIHPAPFYFNINSIESVPTESSETPTNHIISVIGIGNSLGLLPAFSELNQFTITHKDGNVHDRIPSAGVSGNGQLSTRMESNATNSASRKTRLDLSKPMATLQDLFEAFEADLNQQKYAHSGQLQRWIREIRSDATINKILVAPEQKKGPTSGSLPIRFKVSLDKSYEKYSVDNRNMPFEQPDVIQERKGISTFPINAGTTIYDAVYQIMMLSKAVGEDATDANPKTFKTTITAIRTKDEYEINIKIRKYALPHNGIYEVENTGPGKSKNPLEFYINDGVERRDVDIVSLKSNISYRTGDTVMEQQNETTSGAGVVFADREQTSNERAQRLGFYETLYSGVRSLTKPHSIDGLESAQRAGDIHNLLDVSNYGQTTEYEMIIHGNPNLMSDVNRNPADIVNDNDGEFNYYPNPETDPMYVKLTIFEKVFNDESAANDEIPVRFYFDNYYHLIRVVNVFGHDADRSFYQHLTLQRTDDLI